MASASASEETCFKVWKDHIGQLGALHPDTIKSEHVYASALFRNKNLDAAYVRFSEVFKKRAEIFGLRDNETLKTAHNLAACLMNMHKPQFAESIWVYVSNARFEILGPAHQSTMNTVLEYATCLMVNQKPLDAEPLLKNLWIMWKVMQGQHNPGTMQMADRYVSCLFMVDNIEEAQAVSIDAYQASYEANGEDHPCTLEFAHKYACTFIKKGKFVEAREILVSILKLIGNDEFKTQQVLYSYALCLRKLSVENGTIRDILKGVCENIDRDAFPLQYIAARKNYAQFLLHTGYGQDAEELLSETWELASQLYGEGHRLTLTVGLVYGSALMQNRKIDCATRHLETLMELQVIVLGGDHADIQKAKTLFKQCVMV